MSVNSAMIQAMVDKGLSGQDIADIIKASEVKLDRTAADRQARYRERKKGKRNAVTSRRDPPIERNHTPVSEISSDDETQKDAGAMRDADWIEIPDWIPPKPWNAFLEMRRDKGAWPSAGAVELLVSKLERWRAKGHDPGEVLDTSTVSNWTGIFEPKAPRNGQHSTHQRASVSDIGREIAAGYAGTGDRVVVELPRLGAAGGYD